MLKWTASAQRLNECPARPQNQRRLRRATIANKENVPVAGAACHTSTPMQACHSPLQMLAPFSELRRGNATSTERSRTRRLSAPYAATLPRYEEQEYSPGASTMLLPSGQHLALRGLLPLSIDPFVEQPRYLTAKPLRKRKLEPDLLATLEAAPLAQPKQLQQPAEPVQLAAATPLRPSTPQHSSKMGDQTLDKLIDAILDSACKADASGKKKSRKSFNLRRRTLVKQQLEAACDVTLSPSYAPGDDPASDLSFTQLPPAPPQQAIKSTTTSSMLTGAQLALIATPEPPPTLLQLPRSVLLQMPTPKPTPLPSSKPTPLPAEPSAPTHSDTFCLETPVRPLKRRRRAAQSSKSATSPLKRYKVDARNYFEVGLALPSSIYV